MRRSLAASPRAASFGFHDSLPVHLLVGLCTDLFAAAVHRQHNRRSPRPQACANVVLCALLARLDRTTAKLHDSHHDSLTRSRLGGVSNRRRETAFTQRLVDDRS